MIINKKKNGGNIQKDALCKIDNYYKVLGVECSNLKKGKNFLHYRRDVKILFEKYENIKLVILDWSIFGDGLVRVFTLYQDIKEKKEDELYVVLPCFFDGHKGKISNTRMFDLFEDSILLINDINIEFWKYVILHYFDRLDISNYFTYMCKRVGTPYTKMGKPLIEFSEVLKKEAEGKFNKLQVKDPFVCVHVRDKGVTKYFSNKTESHLREYDINSLKKSCEYLLKMGIQPVRMGKFEERTLDVSGVIDYAGQHHDDLLDFYLSSRCKFMLGTNSGMSICSPYFGRPLLRVNAMGDNFLYEMIAITDYDMYIPKKLWSEKEKRYLNLKECLDMHEYCMWYATNYRVNGIIIEDNTEEEILEAVKEMNQKIDGTWIVTEKEIEYHRRYIDILENWKSKRKSINIRKMLRWKGFTMPAIPICHSYLEKNLYLLEDK